MTTLATQQTEVWPINWDAVFSFDEARKDTAVLLLCCGRLTSSTSPAIASHAC